MNLHVKNVLHMCMIFMLFLLMRASNIIAKNKELESSPLLRFTTLDQIVSKGFVKVPTLTPRNKPRFSLPPTNKNLALQKFCKNVDREKKKLRWKGFDCHKVQWEADWITKDGYPLVYKVFGKGRNKTLILGGVHSDELTPTQLSFLLIQYLIDNPSSYEGTDYQIMIAPLVNPDGFFGNGYLRTNGLVDLNRNLPTLDWNTHAVKKWRRGGSSHRKFPGYVSNSEIETEFQIDLIKEFQPDKILSIHSPLGFLDFDGPKENHHHSDTLIKSISKKTKIRIVSYSTFPGSLGNYAGTERSIPTVTMELETTNYKPNLSFWRRLLPGLKQAIHYKMPAEEKKPTNKS